MSGVQGFLEWAEVRGELVSIRAHQPADAPRAFELVHDRQPILRWLHWSGPRDVAELAAFYAAWRADGEDAADYHLAVCRNEDGALVGSLGLRSSGHPESADLGYWFGEPYWNRGYASEAVRLACHLAFRHLGSQALTSWVFEGNDASRRVLEKNGFRYVRTSWRATEKGGRQAEWSLALLAEDWEGARGSWRPAREDIRPCAARGSRAQPGRAENAAQ